MASSFLNGPGARCGMGGRQRGRNKKFRNKVRKIEAGELSVGEALRWSLAREQGRRGGLSDNGTASGDSEMKSAGLPPLTVRMRVGEAGIL
jgi:hypothetical protein